MKYRGLLNQQLIKLS